MEGSRTKGGVGAENMLRVEKKVAFVCDYF